MTMREIHKEAWFDYIRSEEHAGSLWIIFWHYRNILCMEIKPQFYYFPWSHTEIPDDEPWVSLQFMICYRESKRKRLDNGKWKMEIRQWKMEDWSIAPPEHLLACQWLLFTMKRKTKKMFINDNGEVYEIIPQKLCCGNAKQETKNSSIYFNSIS